MWPRDAALVAYAFTRAGYPAVARKFFEFSAELLTEEGYFHHKYNPDGSIGSSWHPWLRDGEFSLPIQADETALVLWSLWEYFAASREIETIRPLYRSLVIAAADFLANFRDPTGLPKPCYDLWEERYGVHTFTVAATMAGLGAAAHFAEAFGETEQAARYRQVAAEMKQAARRYLFHREQRCFARMGTLKGKGYELDLTPDASLYGLALLGAFEPEEPELVATLARVREKLWVTTAVGGLARYEGDYYQRASQAVPGNPWFICTLWAAQYGILRARTREALAPVLELLEWTAAKVLPSGVLAEQVHPETGAPLSVSPLTWSHATYVVAVLDYLAKLRTLPQ